MGRVLILGCGGFIGSHLLDRLLADGEWSVTGVDRSAAKIAHLAGHDDLTFHEHDLRTLDGDRLRALVREADVVVHLAALCNPSLYNTRTLETIESNLFQTLPLVRLCREEGRKLVHFSTCEIYGRTIAGSLAPDNPQRDDPALHLLTEDSPSLLGPVHAQRWSYATAKLMVERIVEAEGREHGLRWTVVRPFNFIGPRMDFIPGIDGEGLPRVLACFTEAFLRGKPLALVDGGAARRTFIHISEAVDAVVRILDRPEATDGLAFNIGHPGNETTIAALAERMIAIWERLHGTAWPHGTMFVEGTDFYGEGYEDSDRRVPDITRARTLLDWDPCLDLDATLERTVPEYLEAYGAVES